MLDKKYNAKDKEKKWQNFWESENIFSFKKESKKKPFVIDVPPPYASAGHLHVGHGLHYTQFEIIARYKRMAGFNVHFAPGFDDNGLPTEKFVEEKFDIEKSDTSRAEFRKLCMKESKKVEKLYADKVFKKLGHSYDWSLLYTTIGKEAQKVSQMSFLDLVEKNEAYRKEEPVLWCPYHQTALAQAEVEDKQRNVKLNHIYFELENGKKIEIATTRPEFLHACVGIFVHPEDERYKDLVGKNVTVPISDHKVKVMTDENVDKEFGSGIMMVCTFGDTEDIEKYKKHDLPLKIIVNKEGKLNKKAGKYEGMSLDEAKEKIIKELDKQNKLIKQEDLTQNVGVCWRCSTPVEYIVTKQWFIHTLKHKKELLEKGRKVNWHPSYFLSRYEDWVKNLAWDWCISRQRYYGVPIPVWYCKDCGKPKFPKKDDLPVDPLEEKPKEKCKCGSSEFRAESDVFDTWMTSSMTPEIATRWLEKPNQFENLFPNQLRPQAQDIIRTWAFYTILKSHLHFNKIPWEDIALGTFVLDPKGHGMSKSKGNVVWVDDLLEDYNVDVFRYWVGTAKWGSDIPFKEKDLKAGQKFLTKLWNASRFALMHLKDYKPQKPEKLELIDKWAMSKINKVIDKATKAMNNYKTSESKFVTEQFFWNTFCDNYLEMIKDRMYNSDKYEDWQVNSAKYTLYYMLLNTLKLLAPIVPHITEEIYQSYFREFENKKSIHIANWPKIRDIDEDILDLGEKAVEVIKRLRKYKSENQMSMNDDLKQVTINNESLKDLKDVIKTTMNIKKLKFSEVKDGIKTESGIKLKV